MCLVLNDILFFSKLCLWKSILNSQIQELISEVVWMGHHWRDGVGFLKISVRFLKGNPLKKLEQTSFCFLGTSDCDVMRHINNTERK